MEDIPWGNKQNLEKGQFYNRIEEKNTIKNILNTTKTGNSPNILLTGIRSVGKTVFLKEIKKEMEKEYLIIYIDFSQVESFKKNKLTIKGLLEYYFKRITNECNKKKINLRTKKIEKFFKTNDFYIKDITDLKGVVIPIPGKESNVEDLFDFVMRLPEEIYEDNKDKINGIIIFIDEFQIINELNKYKESFLWKIRSYIQEQRYIAYVFSGSMSLQDELLLEIAGKNGVFGGRLITFHLNPFLQTTVKNYLDEKVPELKFTKKGFERFYKCTQGLPAYVNMFARLLNKNTILNEDDVIKEFDNSLSYIGSEIIVKWARLTRREQDIIISLLDKPKKRIEISKDLNVSTGSLSNYLIKLQNLSLISYNGNKYQIEELILKRWLKIQYETTGDYPYKKL